MSNRFKSIGFVAAVCLLQLSLAACGKKNVTTSVTPPAPSLSPVVEPAPPAPPARPAETRAASLSDEELFERKSLAQLNSENPLAHIFFDVDSAELRAADQEMLQANSAWLRRWHSARVVIEGHGDSRGTPEYNLALGDRRAQAVTNYLLSLGIDAGRVAVVTKGKDQPFCWDEIESCWQSNRRAHFVISAK